MVTLLALDTYILYRIVGRQPAGLCAGHRGEVPAYVDQVADRFLGAGADPGGGGGGALCPADHGGLDDTGRRVVVCASLPGRGVSLGLPKQQAIVLDATRIFRCWHSGTWASPTNDVCKCIWLGTEIFQYATSRF